MTFHFTFIINLLLMNARSLNGWFREETSFAETKNSDIVTIFVVDSEAFWVIHTIYFRDMHMIEWAVCIGVAANTTSMGNKIIWNISWGLNCLYIYIDKYKKHIESVGLHEAYLFAHICCWAHWIYNYLDTKVFL